MIEAILRRSILIVSCVLIAAACVPLSRPAPPVAGSAAVSPAGAITVSGPFSRTAPQAGNGGAFMTITSSSDQADRLVSAASPAARAAELHETFDDNGVMRMRPVRGGFELPAGGTLELKPGGKHIMLIGLVAALAPGREIEITLVFEKAGPVTVKVPVRAP